MTTMFLATRHRATWQVSEFALVLGFSVAGLIISFALALATWTDGPIVGP